MVKLFNIPLFLLVLLTIVLSGGGAFLRLEMDTDIVRSLPADSAVVRDALAIFDKHPIHDQIAIDIHSSDEQSKTLLACGHILETDLLASGLFLEVGSGAVADRIPELALHVVSHLPLSFSARELQQEIAPRLEADHIEKRLQEMVEKLSGLEGIGQEKFLASDPLGFMEPVMARLAMLAPFSGVQVVEGFVISKDGKHLLLTAKPKASGTDTASARQLATVIQGAEKHLNEQFAGQNPTITLTPVGAYRAALDNEQIIRHDVNFALFLSMLGICLLLFAAFPRPLIGLFSLVPALFGTAVSLLLFSFIHPSISLMVLGFGGAIISITVDHGIGYLLFLDRPQKTKGKEAAHEIRSIGLLAVLTTCGAFLTLSVSGFPVFVQLGQFTAMGMLFSFLFVHFIFPHITPSLTGSKRRRLPLQNIVDRLYNTGKKGFVCAVLLASMLLFYAKPDFQVSLASMNTVSEQTLAADTLFQSVWGNVEQKVVLMLSADSAGELMQKNDQLLGTMEAFENRSSVAKSFVTSMIFPGKQRARENHMAWKQFWNNTRVATLEQHLMTQGARFGFSKQAFAPFLQSLRPEYVVEPPMLDPAFYPLFEIIESEGKLNAFVNINRGEGYNSEEFYTRYHSLGKIFDGPYFSAQLADILFRSFSIMLGIIALAILVFLLLFYADLKLTLLTLLPPLFSYICTLGTMHLLGQPLDIPALMLSIVILGMGIDYSIYLVRAHQRYRESKDSAYGLIRMTVFMAGVSTLIGFGVLCFAKHSLLRSIGITSVLGIGYSLLGAFVLLPPLLNWYFARSADCGNDVVQRVRMRYRLMEAYPRMFARFKLKTDPMFADLPDLLAKRRERIRLILDIGCGYGVPGCWCLEYCTNAKLIGLDPDLERTRVARLAMGDRGRVITQMASSLPSLKEPADLVLVLDMLHYLDDAAVGQLFTNCFSAMANDGILLIRYVIYPESRGVSWAWRLEDMRAKRWGERAYYRTRKEMALLAEKTGFVVETNSVTTSDEELVWLLARVERK